MNTHDPYGNINKEDIEGLRENLKPDGIYKEKNKCSEDCMRFGNCDLSCKGTNLLEFAEWVSCRFECTKIEIEGQFVRVWARKLRPLSSPTYITDEQLIPEYLNTIKSCPRY